MRQDRGDPSEDEVRMLREKARHIRLETIRLIEIAKVGHYSSVFRAPRSLPPCITT